MLGRAGNWKDYLSRLYAVATDDNLRKYSRSGRPAGDDAFLDVLETLTRRRLRKLKPGPSPGIRVSRVNCRLNSKLNDAER